MIRNMFVATAVYTVRLLQSLSLRMLSKDRDWRVINPLVVADEDSLEDVLKVKEKKAIKNGRFKKHFFLKIDTDKEDII